MRGLSLEAGDIAAFSYIYCKFLIDSLLEATPHYRFTFGVAIIYFLLGREKNSIFPTNFVNLLY